MSNPTECFHIKWFWMGNSEQMGDVKHCWTPLVFIVSGMVVSRHDQRLDGMCALGLCQWFCLRVGSDLSRRHLGRTSVFSLIWMISTHRSLFFSRVTLRAVKPAQVWSSWEEWRTCGRFGMIQATCRHTIQNSCGFGSWIIAAVNFWSAIGRRG